VSHAHDVPRNSREHARRARAITATVYIASPRIEAATVATQRMD
jgi:hypothetical protein